MRSDRLSVCFIVLSLCSLSYAAASADTDIVKVLKENLKTCQDKEAFDMAADKYGSVIKNVRGKKTTYTFIFYNDKGESGEDVKFESNISQNKKNKAMINIKNTKIYYKTVTPDKSFDYIVYGFIRANGAFCRDPHNPYIWSDKRRSSYIRLSDKAGAWVNVSGYFTKSKYIILKNRFVCAYLPSAYFTEPDNKFPAIYMLDGQQIWDNADCAWKGWKADTAMETLISEHKIKPAIIVGIYNTASRTKEYAGWCDILKEENIRKATPPEYKTYAEEHARMIVEDLIPFVEANFRTVSDRTGRYIAGSSYGAFCSAYLIAKYPQTFIGAGLFSGGGSGYEQLIRESAFADPAQKIYIDIGNGDFIEKQLLPGTESMIEYLKNKGFVQGQNICAQICDKAKHNEEEWSKRFPTFLEFMLK